MTVNKIVILTTCLFISACGDKEAFPFFPRDGRQIEGVWQRAHGSLTTYHFSDGLAVFQSYTPGNLIEKRYTYRVSADTVFLTEYPHSQTRGKWLLHFYTPDTARVIAPVDSFGLEFGIKRM